MPIRVEQKRKGVTATGTIYNSEHKVRYIVQPLCYSLTRYMRVYAMASCWYCFRIPCPQLKDIPGSIQTNNFPDCAGLRLLLCPMLCSSELRTDCVHWFSRHCTKIHAPWLSRVRLWSTIPTAGPDYKQFKFFNYKCVSIKGLPLCSHAALTSSQKLSRRVSVSFLHIFIWLSEPVS